MEWPCQQLVRNDEGGTTEGTKESKPLDEFTHRSINGDHAFGFELAKRDMNRPFVGCEDAQAVVGKIGTFSDPHASVADQQEGVGAQIVAAQELLLQCLVLFRGERPLDLHSAGRSSNIRELS